MVQKAHLLFSKILIIFLFSGCTSVEEKPSSMLVDTSMIPNDTLLSTDENLILDNGIYKLNDKAFSGFIKEVNNNSLIRIASILNGKQHGITESFYSNGKLKDSRSYKAGKAYGKHLGYWENGNPKFDFIYIDDKREGENKQWYKSGQAYAFLIFKDDKEDGMQKAWRENGKPYINYEVKDGFRYGLQKSALCYTLIDGEIK